MEKEAKTASSIPSKEEGVQHEKVIHKVVETGIKIFEKPH